MARSRVTFIPFVIVGSPLRTPQLSSAHTVSSGSFGGSPNAILLSAEEDDVRMTGDGTAPTASRGMRILKDQMPYAWTGPTASMSFIGESGSGYVNIIAIRT